MAKIKVLDSLLASKIAAGEVIERPASVLKELMENSIDAGAGSVSVHLAEGGKRLIKVVDDGEGMEKADAALAFVRHATSKISREDDLDSITTMGFRGEALASIATVSRVVLRSRQRAALCGVAVKIEGGLEPQVCEDGCPDGTSMEVRDIFYNTPARLKFLRSSEGEFARALDAFKRIALVNPGRKFRLVHGSTKVIDSPAGPLSRRIGDLFGEEILKSLIEVDAPNLKGFIGTHELAYATAKGLYIYVNGRGIRDKGINRAILDGYGTLLGGKYPFAVLDLTVEPSDVDVNIHPAKSEVRFRNQRLVYDIVKSGVRLALGSAAFRGADPPKGYDGAAASVQDTAPFSFIREEERAYAPGSNLADPLAGPPAQDIPERVKNPLFLSIEPIGQLWGEFLIAQSQSAENGPEFYVIDQHGAAERAAFERLKKRYFDSDSRSQMLLIPERIEATPQERDSINSAMEHLKRFGFEITPFGPSTKAGGETFIVKSVPELLSVKSAAALIKELCEELSDIGASSRVEKRIEGALMRIACHSVIRGPRQLTRQEAGALLRELSLVDFAGHCPHGRPVVKRFSRAEVEAFFKR